MKKSIYFLSIILLILSCQTKKKIETVQIDQQPPNYLTESSETFNERMEWWRKARFGMFIHWGVYAVPGGTHKGKQINGIGEWIMQNGQISIPEYEKYAKQFNPQKFDANEWAKTMKEAGMKYVVITSKHHDGFALWDSKVSHYNIVDFAPYGKDILKELSNACKRYGVQFGLYHSIMDWHHTDAQAYAYLKEDPNKRENNTGHFAKYLENYLKPQIKELIENYDPAILWFDGEWVEEYRHKQGQELYQYVRTLKPSIIINNRVDKGRSGMQGMNKGDKAYAGDFGTPEQEILEKASDTDWESCMTMNDTWGFKSYDNNWKSSETLIHNLIDVTAKGGNYLLNVGPTAEGIIPKPSVDRLKKIGNWIQINGEAIYNTERLQNDFKQGEHIRFTKAKEGDKFYAITLIKPETTFFLKNLKPKSNSSIYVVGNDTSLQWEFVENEGLKIIIPKEILDTWNEDSYAWVFHINGVETQNNKNE